MEVKKIRKERLGAKVLFPRTQLAGLRCDDREQMPARQDFTLETIQDVPGMGQAHIIVETAAPRMQFQLILTPKGEEQFDDHLGKLWVCTSRQATSRGAQTLWCSSSVARTDRTSHRRTTAKYISASANGKTRQHDGGTCMGVKSEEIVNIESKLLFIGK